MSSFEHTLALEGHTKLIVGLTFSPDDMEIASCSEDHTIRTWNADTGLALLVLCGHPSTVSTVAFSPDARRIVSGSEGYTITTWDAKTD